MKRRALFIGLGVWLIGTGLLLLQAGEERRNPEDFKVKGINKETEFQLSEAKGKFVALHFLLKTECPLCLLHTQTYAQKAEEVPGVVHVFLKPDSPEDIKAWASKFEQDNPPIIYQDPNAELAEKFGIPDGYQFHGETVHFPALIILNPEGKEVFRYVGESNRDRYTFEKFKEKMKELQGK